MRNTNRLGCLSGMGLIAAVVTVLSIAGYVYAQGGLLYNPGSLNAHGEEILGGVKSHADIGGDCKTCHTSPWESAKMEDRCASCHTDIAIQMREATSMHGVMLNDNPDLSCRHCHPEHRGPDAPLTEMTDAVFPHEAVGFSLGGHQFTVAGDAFTCDDCHGNDVSRFDPQVCDTCHRQMDVALMDSHTASFGAICLDCHDGVDSLVSGFNHSRYPFKLTGKHDGLECAKCHTNARRPGDFEAVLQDCYSCHKQDDEHNGNYGTDCGLCHSPDGWKPARFDHSLSAFKLIGEHAEVRCDECHLNAVYKGTPSDCYSCHKQDDEHNGRFGTDCGACHQPIKWEDATFDHNKSNFPLTAGHTNVPCEKCHATGQFAGLSTNCSSCHNDPTYHAGMFGLDCAACHTTQNWFARYNGSHPGIADEGGRGVNHGGTSCRTCHTQTLRAATCTACHNGNNPGGDD